MAKRKDVTTAQTFVFEQTRVARYVALAETAGGFTVPDRSGSAIVIFSRLNFPA